MAKVAVIAGSRSDEKYTEEAAAILRQLGIDHEVVFLSAHREPTRLREYIERSDAEVFIAIAGLAAHLPGFIASVTTRPVIGVPVSAKLGGLDALLSMVQMPFGTPVSTVGIDNARNAALLAAEILALKDPGITGRIEELRESLRGR